MDDSRLNTGKESDLKLPAVEKDGEEDVESDRKLPAKPDENRKRKIKQEPQDDDDQTAKKHAAVEDEVQVVLPVTAAAATTPAVASLPPNEEGDGEVQIVKETLNPVVDFPHQREHCVEKPMAQDPVLCCALCYCYVCDLLANECEEWSNHCHANSKQEKWRNARNAKKKDAASHNGRYLSVKELLSTATRIYPAEMEPPPGMFVTPLKHYQKQSLAFMSEVEQNYSIKSGFLCSEVGMGKSAVVIALIVSHPMPIEQQPTAEQIKEARFLGAMEKQVSVKGTIIFTSKSLLGQWEDEITQHAPQLKVGRHHGKSKLKLADLAECDVIVSCPTVAWSSLFQRKYKYHRIILDESHLLGTVSARSNVVNPLVSDRAWCITATPMISSSNDLDKQVDFLDLTTEFNVLDRDEFVSKYMLRHTKSMIIHGTTALTLPKSTTVVKTISMTEWERETFQEAVDESNNQRLLSRGLGDVLTKIVQMSWYSALMIPLMCEDSSKIERLKLDLTALYEEDPNMRAVVFTQFREQLRFAKKALKGMNLKTYVVDGSKSAESRDKSIRAFQSGDHAGPAVFLATLQAGNVGVTLTAASHVFIMEPCIDPAQEVQAAGRIHRLGQKKQVGVTKYVFEDSCESNILLLHEKIEKNEIDYSNGLLTYEARQTLRIRPEWHCWW